MNVMRQDFTKEFPVLNQYTYINTAVCGLLSESLLEWRRQHDIDFLNRGSIFRENNHEFLDDVRKTVGEFFTCNPQNVAIIPNFSYGFNILLDGLEKKQKVLLLEGDYPSVNWAVEERDFDIFYTKIDENLEENIKIAVEKYHPQVLAFSLVQFISGIKIDLDFLKQLKKDHPELLIIADGTQYCGTEAFNFETSAIDVLGGSGYKWLMAGFGNGFMLFKDEAMKKIQPKTIGFNSTKITFPKENIEFIRHFEPGHQDTLNFGSLGFSISYLNKIGIQNIQQQLENLSRKVKKAFSELDLLENDVVNRKNHSSIFTIKSDEKLFNELRKNNILCSKWAVGIRFSFHFYNTENDLDKVVKVLKNAKN